MNREEKMKIVINNYFKKECSVNTSIREAFEKGFRIGASKVPKKHGKWIEDDGDWFETMFKCSECGALIKKEDEFRSFFCYHCGADMRGEKSGEISVGEKIK